jgi:flagellar biosynthesis protein FliR
MSARDRIVELATDHSGRLHADPRHRGQTGTVIAVVTIGIVAIIGTLIYSQVLSSVGDPSGTAAENRTQLENATVDMTDGFSNAMQLVPVVLIVLVASLVIGVVQRFG